MKHAAEPSKKQLTPSERRSSRMRKILIAVIIILVLLAAGLGYLGYLLFVESQDAAVQQTNMTVVDEMEYDDSSKPSQSSAKVTSVPDLVALIGLSQQDAVTRLGHGAQVTREIDNGENEGDIKKEVQITLTEEPADSRSGTPTVYLSLDERGSIIQAGYSVALSSLGYGTLSFSDAVQNEHVVERTLQEAGLTVADGSAVLPTDKSAYSSYASDGTTLVKENVEFTGVGTAAGAQYDWRSTLTYDYSLANATDNLNDSVRTIYIYISKPAEEKTE